jgi:hypothetical protein
LSQRIIDVYFIAPRISRSSTRDPDSVILGNSLSSILLCLILFSQAYSPANNQHPVTFTMVDPFASAIDEALFLRAKLIMVLTAFMSFMLLDFLICLPAELRYIFYPEAKALLKSDLPKRGRVSVPTLL